MEWLPIRRALLSVTNKDGLADFASFLAQNGVELVSTGGTYQTLVAYGLPVTSVEDVTGFLEMLEGRVKTLHPAIYGGILADKDKPFHMDVLREKNIKPFDLVCVNLYDFSGALEKRFSVRDIIEEIDIGGPCLLRASAKNYHSVLVLPGVAFYAEARAILEANAMKAPVDLRRRCAAAAISATCAYDAMIAEWLGGLE